MAEFTREQLMEVPCIQCDAKIGKQCRSESGGRGHLLVGFHFQRSELRGKLPSMGDLELNSTDKALICYYAFVMLSDSVSSKSEEILGKRMTSQEVQRFFARQAVIELQKDGLLREPSTQKG
jgi:hypothetical protein